MDKSLTDKNIQSSLIKMTNLIRKYKDVFLYKVLEKHLFSCRSVLDVGCGDNSPLGKIPKRFYSEGIDSFKSSIDQSKKKKLHNKYKLGDIRNLGKFYKNKSFDAVIALDVIEHFTKVEALKIIKQMESIAGGKVILMTPNGYLKQKNYDGNPYQAHKSGWTPRELEDLGYKVYGLRGWKFIRQDNIDIKRRPRLVWEILVVLSEFFLFYFPCLSFDLLAIKNLKKEEI